MPAPDPVARGGAGRRRDRLLRAAARSVLFSRRLHPRSNITPDIPSNSSNNRTPGRFSVRFFFAGVQLLDVAAEVFEHAHASHFHGSGELALLDGEFARDDAEFADLLELRELLIDATDDAAHLGLHGWSVGERRGRTALISFHSVQQLGDAGVD